MRRSAIRLKRARFSADVRQHTPGLPGGGRSVRQALAAPLWLAVIYAAFLPLHSSAAEDESKATPPRTLSADAQDQVQRLQPAGASGRPLAVLDKRAARLWLFDAAGRSVGSTPVLLGSARGDHSVPGIGERAMSQIKPEERTTPAGRFALEPGVNADGEDIFWIDYEAAVSLHRVRATNAKERRLQRLASETPTDNRISYGCVNVPVAFYEEQIKPLFASGRGVIYILPEVDTAAAGQGATPRP